MENITNKSRDISIIVFSFTAILITVATLVRVYTDHQDALIKVVTQRIEEAAEKCNLEEVCGNELTLGLLIVKEYIDPQVHPITKEYISEEQVIICEDFKCITKIK